MSRIKLPSTSLKLKLCPAWTQLPAVRPIDNMCREIHFASRLLVPVLALAGSAFAQDGHDWSEPFPPFRVAANLYYGGTKGLANYLVATPQGNILINSDLQANVPMIKAGIEKLGFKFKDIRTDDGRRGS